VTDRAKKFWDKRAERYSTRAIADEATYQEKLEVTRRYLNPDSEVLEFGCGTGSTAISHAPYVKHILATDISSNMIEIARQRAREDDVRNVTFAQSSVDEFAAPDESYDVVLGLNLLHLLDDKDAALEKICRMLRPGGVFVSSTACITDMMPLFRLIAPIGVFFHLFPPVAAFSVKELTRALTVAGLEIEHEWSPGKNKAIFIVARKSR